MKKQKPMTKDEWRQKRVAFIKYPTATKDGHIITVVNLKRKILGRIKRTTVEGKILYTAYDRENKLLFAPSSKLHEIEKKFISYAKTKGLTKEDSMAKQVEKEPTNAKQQKTATKKENEKPLTEEEKKFWRVQELRQQQKDMEKDKEKHEISR